MGQRKGMTAYEVWSWINQRLVDRLERYERIAHWDEKQIGSYLELRGIWDELQRLYWKKIWREREK